MRQIGRGRLAVGAGHANHSQLARREVVPRSREIGERDAGVVDFNDREVRIGEGGLPDRAAVGLHDDGRRAGGKRLRDVAVPVHREAGHGDETVARGDGAGVLPHGADGRRRRIAAGDPVRGVGEQLGKRLGRQSGRHRCSCAWAVGGVSECQAACKPGSVSARRRRRPSICDGGCPPPEATYPEAARDAPAARRSAPPPLYLVLLRAGLAQPAGLPTAGALLPHHFTLTAPAKTGAAVCFCGAFRQVALPGSYPAPCPVEPGLSSSRAHAPPAAARRPGALSLTPQRQRRRINLTAAPPDRSRCRATSRRAAPRSA